jgi:hypothetical protein
VEIMNIHEWQTAGGKNEIKEYFGEPPTTLKGRGFGNEAGSPD